jgi:Mrp family chromosome partitioning ATPase/predicted Fe-Mo cluster-binding NifX family protein
MEVWIHVKNGVVEAASFLTDGCGPSLASGSMATSIAIGNPLGMVGRIVQQDILDVLGGLPEDFEHCALLAANTLKAACHDHLSKSSNICEEQNDNCDYACESCNDPTCSSSRVPAAGDLEPLDEQSRLQNRLGCIQHKIIVLSGKGGVGKSTVAVNIATALTMAGKRVGLLDVDIHGPSIPTMLGLNHEEIRGTKNGFYPIEVNQMKVMSLGFLLENQDDAIILRGPMKTTVIKQFLMDVVWGDLDYMIIDSPPGTGDEPLSVCQLIGNLDGAVIVTTPQKVAAVDVRKSITFCRQLQVPVLGVIENMSGFICPKCGEVTPILSSGGGRVIAEDMDTPFLGSLPMDPQIAEACDQGRPFVQYYASSPSASIMRDIIQPILDKDPPKGTIPTVQSDKLREDIQMKIAIPLADGRLANHFGHCEQFAFISVDPAEKKILEKDIIEAPPHQPGLLPPWLAERGVTIIIAGGMGQRALQLFAEQGIQVMVGAPVETPEKLVIDYFSGVLQLSGNVCDH